MSKIVGLGTAVPPYKVSQLVARDFAAEHFHQYLPHMHRLTQVFQNAKIDNRYFVVTHDWWRAGPHSLKERNDLYIKWATDLGTAAINRALADAGLTTRDVDNLVVVSSTGIATPSLDAYLINCMGLRRDVRRTPIWGLGCAGGVAGLARTSELARAFPKSITVLLAVETCGLTFQFEDHSKKNFISTSLFADGAAAVVIAGAERAEEGIEVLDSQSTLWPDSIRVMGWDVVDTGLDVVFGAQIPRYVVDTFRPEVDQFLERHTLTIPQIAHLVFHPGGAKVIEAYDKALDLTNGHLDPTHEILRLYGNMSSPTVLFVLDYIRQHRKPQPGEYGLLAALGPGFSAEQVLIRF